MALKNPLLFGILAVAAMYPQDMALSQNSAGAFRPARPATSMAGYDPANRAYHDLSYCIQVQMVQWYNAIRGRFSNAELGQVAASAVARCDHLVDAATRHNIAQVQQLAAIPKFAERAKAALANNSYAVWRADQIAKSKAGAKNYIRGIQIATKLSTPDESQ